MNVENFIKEQLVESSEIKLKIVQECSDDIKQSVNILVDAFKNGKKLLLCGNGGSAHALCHIAAEFMIRLSHDLDRPAIAAVALTTDTSNLTAGGNDIGYENVFARNVEGLGNDNDVLIAISTSGNSGNVVKAVEKAKEKNVKVIGFLGGTGGKLLSMVDQAIVVPSNSTQRIQEGHITIAHIICELTERILYDNK
ncbi:MAG: SIS domain-containing protein [Rhodothermaceae bacterium]